MKKSVLSILLVFMANCLMAFAMHEPIYFVAAAKASTTCTPAKCETPSLSSRVNADPQKNMELWYGGRHVGDIRPDGDIFINGRNVGRAKSNGEVVVNGRTSGEMRSNGDVFQNGRKVGEVRSNGDVFKDGRNVGQIRSNGDIFKDGRCIGMVRNMVNPKWAAMIYFFDFFSF